ncbi:MAG: hypothetical protein ACLVJO_04810 [[Clostridium] scindens]
MGFKLLGTMPMAVFTLEHFDWSGKTIRPFCTMRAAAWDEAKWISATLQERYKAWPGYPGAKASLSVKRLKDGFDAGNSGEQGG